MAAVFEFQDELAMVGGSGLLMPIVIGWFTLIVSWVAAGMLSPSHADNDPRGITAASGDAG
jgi:hypothetical protein